MWILSQQDIFIIIIVQFTNFPYYAYDTKRIFFVGIFVLFS